MFTRFNDAVAWLQNELPFFQQAGASAYHPGLDTTRKLLTFLGNPQDKLKYLHIGGTNGKGSCSHMLAAVFASAGFQTGLYTSPHLKRITERCRINGVEMAQDDFLDFVNAIRPAIDRYKPTFFEVTTAMALHHFANQNVEIAVMEVGLGGRLDATNVITPEVALITNIGHDHLDIIGPTLQDVAREKAGIMKSGVPVVIGEWQEVSESVFKSESQRCGSPICFASDLVQVIPSSKGVSLQSATGIWQLNPDLKGDYQLKNMSSVLAVVELMQNAGWTIPSSAIVDGINNAARKTGLKGRWQKISEHPLIICDTAHNPEGLRQVSRQVVRLGKRIHWVLGMVADKDVMAALRELPTEATYYFCRAKNPRAMDPHELATLAGKAGLIGQTVQDVNDALRVARTEASADDVIVVGGSTYVVGEVEEI